VPIHAPFLKYFREVARCGSVRLAARRLYVASSAVNRQILKIEDELGVKLFERTTAGMVLTPAGALLAEHVERVVSDAERTLAEIKAAVGGAERPITITGEDSVLSAFLPPALVALHADFPDAYTAFKAAGGRELCRQLSIGGADVALGFDAQESSGLACVAWRDLPVGAVVSCGHPLAERERVSLQECAAYPMILPDPSWPLRELLDREIARIGISPNTVTSSSSLEFLRFMLERQHAIGFRTVIGIESKLQEQELRHLPLYTPEPMRQRFGIWVVAQRRRSAAMERLLALLAQRLEGYGSP
jgi:DNA-binding transcriptional LysR family regulator